MDGQVLSLLLNIKKNLFKNLLIFPTLFLQEVHSKNLHR